MQNGKFVGKVTKSVFGKGSKSEHEAVFLETDKGKYALRRQGGNPFYDPELEELVGKRIQCNGFVEEYTLIISNWTVLNEGHDEKS
jgi:hypothetical protein